MSTMLEQAKLDEGILSFIVPSSSTALITFQSSTWADRCIQHFNGRKWGNSDVSALLVHPEEIDMTSMAGLSCPPFKMVALSADAPIFVPAKTLSATAPVEKIGARERICSDTSTVCTDGDVDECVSEDDISTVHA